MQIIFKIFSNSLLHIYEYCCILFLVNGKRHVSAVFTMNIYSKFNTIYNPICFRGIKEKR
jgi:hypothetical protein